MLAGEQHEASLATLKQATKSLFVTTGVCRQGKQTGTKVHND